MTSDDGVLTPDDIANLNRSADRVDLLAGSVGLLLTASVVIGIGLIARLAADYTQSRVGGSVTGFQVGDRFEDDDEDAPELPPGSRTVVAGSGIIEDAR